MVADWSKLRDPDPKTLRPARGAAHFALQWAARAATANLTAAPDDSHTAFSWVEAQKALVSQPMPKGIRIGLRVGSLELLFFHGAKVEVLALAGRKPVDVDQWLDVSLAKAGLQRASNVKLPYAIPAAPFLRDHRLEALGRWFGAAAEVLGEVRGKYAQAGFAPGPACCWPHHFDIAVLVPMRDASKSIGIGISPGDEYYQQPYAYISPYPAPKEPKTPELPAGHWHTKDFFGAVVTAEELLRERDPRAALVRVIEISFEAGRAG